MAATDRWSRLMETIPSHIVANEMSNIPGDSNSADVEIKEPADTGLEYLSDGVQPAMKQAGRLRLESAVIVVEIEA
jgi:hypothetical protein